MKRFTSVMALLIASVSLGAQYVFQVDTAFANQALILHEAILMDDGSVMAVGDMDNYMESDPFVLKLSPKGKWLALKKLNHPNLETDYRLVEAHDGGVLIGCRSFGYPIKDKDGYVDVLLIKLNENLEEEWTKVLPAFDFADICKSTNKEYLVYSSGLYETFGANELDYDFLQVHRIDEQGNVIWVERFTTGEFESHENAFIHGFGDGSFLVSASVDTGWNTTKDVDQGFILKIDAQGKEVYRKFLHPDHQKEVGFLWPSQFFEFKGKSYYYRNNSVFEFNPDNGNEKQIKFLPGLSAIDATSEGISAMIGGGENAIISRLDEGFNLHWSRNMYSDKIGVAALTMPDGGSLFFYGQQDSKTYSVHAIKTDCQGNSASWNPCTLGVDRVEMKHLQVYPNPTSGRVCIQGEGIQSYSIHALSGALIQQGGCSPGLTPILLEELPDAMYLLKVNGEFGMQVFPLLYQSKP